MRAIVLVKQVPDLRLGGVGVRADGTIDRSAAPSITNPADLHAIEAAVQLADEVCALSMGPPQAEETLRQALEAGASRAVLLCDHAFAGSDTWATANALAAAIEWIGGADLVLCGISAIDGETGQVGPSVAQRLGWPQATGCESLAIDGRSLIARRVVEGGYERLRLPLPAVVTVGETGFAPRLPDAAPTATGCLHHDRARDRGRRRDPATEVGLAASPTKVAKMTPSPLPDRGCRYVGDGFGYDDLVRQLMERGALTERARRARSSRPAPAGGGRGSLVRRATPTCGSCATWPMAPSTALRSSCCPRRPSSPRPSAAGWAALVLAADAGSAVDAAGRHGADVVYLAEDPALATYLAEPYARVVADAAAERQPVALLFAATTTGRDLAPRIASMLGTGLAADCTDLYVDSWTRHGTTYERLLHMVRPAMAGGVLATCLCPVARPQMATVRPGVFELRLSPRQPRVVPLEVRLAETDLRVEVVERQISAADVDLRDADVVIAGGAGCDATSWHLVEELAQAIGGRVAASRGAVEAGLAPRAQQVGQTGATVRPHLYVACGISAQAPTSPRQAAGCTRSPAHRVTRNQRPRSCHGRWRGCWRR